MKEYRERHKTNQLVDKRFGEYDENLTAEEKMMKRFMMEKQVSLCIVFATVIKYTSFIRESIGEKPCSTWRKRKEKG